MTGTFYTVDLASIQTWPKLSATQMLTRDMFAAANLLVDELPYAFLLHIVTF